GPRKVPRLAAERVGGPVLVEDTSLCFNGPGRPTGGVHQVVPGRSGPGRPAQTVGRIPGQVGPRLAACSPTVAARPGVCPGSIADKPAGDNRFGWDPIFKPDGFHETFAQMVPEVKNTISHRAKALSLVRDFLRRRASGFIGRYLVRSLRSAGHPGSHRRQESRRRRRPATRQQDALTRAGVQSVRFLEHRTLGPALRLSTVAYRRYVSELFDSRIGRIRWPAAAAAAVRPKPPPSRLVGVSAMRADPPPRVRRVIRRGAGRQPGRPLCASIEAAVFEGPDKINRSSKLRPLRRHSPHRRRAWACRPPDRDGGAPWPVWAWAVPVWHRRPDRQRERQSPSPGCTSGDAVGVLEHALLADNAGLRTPSFNSDVAYARGAGPSTNAETGPPLWLGPVLRRSGLLTNDLPLSSG
uniref:Non-canonical purine NTP pyrophosphatase n=1 Tax=Macrostomum lignano TaxID=282301 RepID=A0A1I8FM33_9PLAT